MESDATWDCWGGDPGGGMPQGAGLACLSGACEYYVPAFERRRIRDYIRDQLLLVRQTVEKTESVLVTQAIAYCLANNIASAVDFTAIIREQQRASQPVEHKVISLNPLSGTHLSKAMMEPNKSDILDYQKLLKKLPS